MISRWTSALALVGVVGATGCVVHTGEDVNEPHHHHHHDSSPPPAPPPPRKHDAKPKDSPKETKPASDVKQEWVKLGEGTANGKDDHDVIEVGKAEGTFQAIRFVVKNSNVKMTDVVVHFADGSKFSPPTRVEFKEGTTSNNIDLPGERRVIKSVNFRYSDAAGSGRAVVEVWGI